MASTDGAHAEPLPTWDLESLLGDSRIEELLEAAALLADRIETYRGRVADLDVAGLAALMTVVAEHHETVGRAGSYAGLRFAEDTLDESRGALMARVQEHAAALAARLLFLDLEWVAVDPALVEQLLSDPRLDFCAHHLRSLRRFQPHLLSEPEERVLAEKSVAGATAWVRLFEELTSAIEVQLPAHLRGGGDESATVGLEQGLSLLQHPDRDARRVAADAITEALRPGLRTRAFVFNTLLLDKAIEDRLRAYPSWISARNLDNEASDESVEALIEAVTSRYEIPQRWYELKARLLGLDRLSDFDRMAPVGGDDTTFRWDEARELVLEAYGGFSRDLAGIARRFFDERWIDVPLRPGKRPGAFCAYTVPSHHPYLLLNWTGRSRDVATLAHELGHGLHAWLAREQGVFHQSTPLTMAETASVFGETVTTNALLADLADPDARLSLLARSLEDSIATVFRQVAMNRFEDAVHRSRREEGELAVDRFAELWRSSQAEMLGGAVEITAGYQIWWSYIPHFMGTPGYVYAYVYGQLLALSLYAQFEEQGAAFVPAYLRLLASGGSMSPTELGRIAGCDLEDPDFWSVGLGIVVGQLDRATEAASAAGLISPTGS